MEQETVKAFEAKTHFAELLNRAEKGERIAITRRGIHVATLIPAEPARSEVEAAVERLRERRKKLSLKGLSIKELIEEGRRF